MHDSIHNVHLLMTLLMVASVVAIFVKWIKLPYSIALVIAGLVIGVFHMLPPIEMTPELILIMLLPALLFEASWNLDLSALRQNWRPITLFATVGVILSAATIGLILDTFGGLDLYVALLFGCMISATDPISVLAMFKKMGMDKRLNMILEGESIFNDGTAVVLFKLMLGIVMANATLSVPQLAGSFLTVCLGGAVIGIMIGFAGSHITRLFDDHLLEIMLTTLVAYGSYLLCEQVHVSPVLGVVCAGIVVGNYGSRTGMSPTTRLSVNAFWEYAAFFVNSIVFLLIGLQIKMDLLLKYAPVIGVAILGILAGRIIVVYGLSPLVSTKELPIPLKWQHALCWGALRGSLSMALALSLPTTFPQREAIIVTTFGVVLFTLIVKGLTVEPLVKLLKLRPEHSKMKDYLALKSELMTEISAYSFLNEMWRKQQISEPVFKVLETSSLDRQTELKEKMSLLHVEDASLQVMETTQARHALLESKKDYAHQLLKQGILPEELYNDLRNKFDKELEEIGALEHGAKEES